MCIVLLLPAGCSNKPEKAAQERVAPVSGGKLNIGSAVEPDTWNPIVSELAAVQEVGRLLFGGLLMQNDKGEWVADLAAEVPTVANGGVAEDGLTVTYRLKPNAKWQDGQRVTARDVRFTHDFIMRNIGKVLWRPGYEKIQSVTTPDESTVVVRFSEPYGLFLYLFPFILPSHQAAELSDLKTQNFSRMPVGSGPFILREWRRGDALVFEANPGYHRGRPILDSITYKIVTDRQIVLSQLKIGEVDIVNNIGFDQLDQVRSITAVNTFVTPGTIWEHFDFNLDNPLFMDARVRQAISLAIDRAALIEKTLKNAAFPAHTDIHPLSWAYLRTLKTKERSVPQAKELLAGAGWKAGYDGILTKNGRRLSFALTVPSGEKPREAVSGVIAAQLREVGIEARLQPVARMLFFGEILPNRRFEAVLFAWVNSTEPDNYDMWNSRRIPTRENRMTGRNYAGWRAPELDSLLENTRGAGTNEIRREAYSRIQEMLLSEVPVIPLYYRAEVSAAKRSVVNFKPNVFAGNFWNAWEWGLR